MEKYEKQTKLYLALTIIMGSLLGYLDTGDLDLIYLFIFGIGMAALSIVIGIFAEAIISTVIKRNYKANEEILDEGINKENELKLKNARDNIIAYRNRFMYGFLFSLSMVIYELAQIMVF